MNSFIKNQDTKSTTTKLSVALTNINSMIKEICVVLLNMKFKKCFIICKNEYLKSQFF